MKKKMALTAAFALTALTLAGCSGGEPYEEKSYTADAAEVAAIELDVKDRRIEVSLSEDGQIHLNYSENDKEFYDLSLSDDRVLTVSLSTNKEWTDYIGGAAPEDSRLISLQVPDGLLEALTLSTTNEDIVLPALTVTGEVSLSSNGGDILFDRLDAGKAVALTGKNGDITGKIAGSCDDYAVSCDIKKGESSLPESKEGGDRTLKVSMNNGDVDIRFVSE